MTVLYNQTIDSGILATFAQNTKPPCGCLIEGFAKWWPEMKLKITRCHYLIADHYNFGVCNLCGIFSQNGYFLMIH